MVDLVEGKHLPLRLFPYKKKTFYTEMGFGAFGKEMRLKGGRPSFDEIREQHKAKMEETKARIAQGDYSVKKFW
jgi:hypothetical protein